jgi:hypothetical protein
MKSLYQKIGLLVMLLFSGLSCGKDFLDIPPQDRLTIDNFFETEDQINATTATLYGFPWFNLNDKTIYAIGDLGAGNMFSWDGAYRPFQTFTVQPDNARLNEAWESLFKVVSLSNSIINNLPTRVDPSIDKAVVNRALAEARFMRALAYFYLVRTWGPVPIVEDSEELALNFKVPRNRTEDIYTFILRDLAFVESNSPEFNSGSLKGRVTRAAAQALLAKVYLYQKNYAKAREKAEAVINGGQHDLMAKYEDLFKAKNNYNKSSSSNRETIFAWQWVAVADGWGTQNTNQAYFAPFGQGITEVGDGWGSVMPSMDLLAAYEDNDKRKHATVMTPGEKYPELVSKTNPNGYTYPATAPFPSANRANIRKYIVGSPLSGDGPVYFMRNELNTYVLRYADVLLIHAEAIMAGGASTGDAKALASFNAVRRRAGLPEKTSITEEDMLKERRVEFAFEHDYWYDLGRMDRAKATAIIAAQHRGTFDFIEKFTPTPKDFLMPIPQAETSANPRLLDEPVAYTFK